MRDVISSFGAEYAFLSNFHPVDVSLDGEIYPSVEHAYQAAKTRDVLERQRIREAPKPGKAKRLGQKVSLRADWETVRVAVMRDLLWQKYALHPDLAELLLSTGDAELIEGNRWGDTFWGVCNGEGENTLGEILMETRRRLCQGRS